MDALLRCTDCPRLAGFLADVRTRHPDYHARPVLPFGDPKARLLVVGLAPGMHGANRTGRPFTGDYAGILLYESLHAFGFASRAESVAADDGLQLIDCRISNAVKCLPPENKPEPAEIKTCNRYLADELRSAPELRVLLALGLVAHKAVLMALDSSGVTGNEGIVADDVEHSISNLCALACGSMQGTDSQIIEIMVHKAS